MPTTWRPGWDLADDLPPGVTLEALKALLLLAAAPAAASKKSKGKSKTKTSSSPSKSHLKQSVEDAKRERDDLLKRIKKLHYTEGRTEAEAATYQAKARELAEEYLARYGTTEEDLESAMADVEIEDDNVGADIDGDALLDSVHAFLRRFISYPSRHASIAHTLWIAHTHMMDLWDSTPRIAFMSPERGSGKTRALEVTEFLSRVPSTRSTIRSPTSFARLPTTSAARQSCRTSSTASSPARPLIRPTSSASTMPATGRELRLGAASSAMAPLRRRSCQLIALSLWLG